jgi:hypothetical protein
MIHRRNRIVIGAGITAAMIAAMAVPAGARTLTAAAANSTASSPVPVDIRGDITWTWVHHPVFGGGVTTTGDDKETGTYHIDLTNVVNGTGLAAVGGDSSTDSVTDSLNWSFTGSSGCTVADKGSLAGSGPLPYWRPGLNSAMYVAFDPSLTSIAVTLNVNYPEAATRTFSGPPPCSNGTVAEPGGMEGLPECLDSSGNPLYQNGPLDGSLDGTYPDATANLGCSGTYTGGGTFTGGTDTGSYRVTGTLTITPSCGGGTAPPGGLCITSPPDGSTVALTDAKYVEPQPAEDNDVAPAHRFLIVAGTTSCPDVTLDSVKATVKGDNWDARLPVKDLGPQTLTAHGSGSAACDKGVSGPRRAASGAAQTTSTVTLINLKIIHPDNDGDKAPVTAAPKMPDIGAKVQVEGYSGDTSAVSFSWTLDIKGEYIDRHGWHAYSQNYSGSQTGTSATWSPDFPEDIGGWGRLVVTASLPGVLGGTVHSDPRWINITGTNPGRASVELYIEAYADLYPFVIMHIDCLESNHTFNQFNPDKNTGEEKTPGVPRSLPNPATDRPLFGEPPAGIGIAQLDPASFPHENWDWKLNVSAGIAEFEFDYATATTLRDRTQAALDTEYEQLRARLNAERTRAHMDPIPDRPVLVRDLTETEIVYDAIRLYNYSGGEYIFDLKYEQGPDLTIDAVGSKDWKKNNGGQDPNYVRQVQACAI